MECHAFLCPKRKIVSENKIDLQVTWHESKQYLKSLFINNYCKPFITKPLRTWRPDSVSAVTIPSYTLFQLVHFFSFMPIQMHLCCKCLNFS
jgi:hypothetical protein